MDRIRLQNFLPYGALATPRDGVLRIFINVTVINMSLVRTEHFILFLLLQFLLNTYTRDGNDRLNVTKLDYLFCKTSILSICLIGHLAIIAFRADACRQNSASIRDPFTLSVVMCTKD